MLITTSIYNIILYIVDEKKNILSLERYSRVELQNIKKSTHMLPFRQVKSYKRNICFSHIKHSYENDNRTMCALRNVIFQSMLNFLPFRFSLHRIRIRKMQNDITIIIIHFLFHRSMELITNHLLVFRKCFI